MKEKKKVLLVVSTLNTGGAQRAFANMSLGFPEGWECDFLLNDVSGITYSYRGNLIDLGLKPKLDKTGILYQLKVFIKRYVKLRHLKRSGQYVACISALTSANAVNVLTGNKYCRTIISIRTFMSKIIQEEKDYRGWIKGLVMRFLSNKADYVIAVSKGVCQDLIDNFGLQEKKAVTIYNGYDLKDIERLSMEPLNEIERKWVDSGKYLIVTSGRLSIEKGHVHLIKAFRKVKEKFSNACLLVLGDGDLREELDGLSKRLGLEKDIILCGFVKNPYKIIRRCHLFVLSSLFEGFPNALAESLCLGVPAISTDCDSGAREILAPDTEAKKKVICGFEKAEYGILCPVFNEEEKSIEQELTNEESIMADAILYLLENITEYERYREKSRIRAGQLSIGNTIKEWFALIDNDQEV